MNKSIKAIVIAFLSIFGFMLVGPIQSADAATVQQKAVSVALSERGKPYRYGGTGPYSFDCSGLAQYSFKRAGKYIPRTTTSQYNKTRHVSASKRRPGTLVFFRPRGSRTITHVGIYVGSGYMVDAQTSHYYGRKVIKEKISGYWSRSYYVYYGEVR